MLVNAAACRGIAPATVETAWNEMMDAGAIVLENAAAIADYVKNQ